MNITHTDEGATFAVSGLAAPYLDNYGHKMLYEQLSRELGNKLWTALQQVRNPCVVKYDEFIEPVYNFDPYSGLQYERVTMRVCLTPVQYEHIRMPSYQFYDASNLLPCRNNWLAKLLRRLKLI